MQGQQGHGEETQGGEGAGRRGGRWLRRCAWGAAVVALLGALVFGYTAWRIQAFAAAHGGAASAAPRVDAIIVLGAAAWGREPSPVFRERINHAIALYERGRASKVIFTGGRRLPTDLAESEVARDYAIARGVRAEDILIETRSTTTEENLEEAAAVARGLGLETFLVVSDPLHMRRAALIAEDLGLRATPAPTPTTRYTSWRQKGPFLLRETYLAISYQVERVFD